MVNIQFLEVIENVSITTVVDHDEVFLTLTNELISRCSRGEFQDFNERIMRIINLHNCLIPIRIVPDILGNLMTAEHRNRTQDTGAFFTPGLTGALVELLVRAQKVFIL